MSSSARQLRKAITFVAALFAATLAGASIASLTEGFMGEIEILLPPLYVSAPALLVLAFISILIHEMGHVVGGLLARFKFVLLIVGPLKVMNQAGRMVLSVNRVMQVSSGLSLCVPIRMQPASKSLFLFVAGGPSASMIAAAVFAFITTNLLGLVDSHPIAGYAISFSIFGALFNAGVGVVAFLPFETRGLDSDGRLLLDLIKGGRKAEIKVLGQALSADSIAGVRPREWNADHVQNLLTVATHLDEKNAAMAQLMAYYHFLDSKALGHAEKCVDWLKQHVDRCPSFLQPGIWLEMAFFEVEKRKGNCSDAQLYLEKAMSSHVDQHVLARVEAAVLFLEGRYGEAIDRASEGIALAQKGLLQAGLARAEKDWMQGIVSKSAAQLAQLI